MDSELMGLEKLPTTGPGDDLSSIAWVHEELRRSLESAHKSLRRFFAVDAECVAVAVLWKLAQKGEVEPSAVARAIKDLGIDPDKASPLRS